MDAIGGTQLRGGPGGAQVTLGNGNNDTVEFTGFYSSVTLGNGARDVVTGSSAYGTIALGDGAGDVVNAPNVGFENITLGKGARDTVNAQFSSNADITLGNGARDVVNAQNSFGDSITVGHGNDTIYAGQNTTITVGTGHDSFVFEQTTPGSIGTATVTGFEPHKDSFTFSNQLTTSVSYHDNAQGNAVITVDNAGDTITLVGVHASELHPSDFHFADPVPMVADLHGHNFLLV